MTAFILKPHIQRWYRAARSGGAFHPTQIDGLVALYEPSVSSMFQDATGTTPVTADEDPIGHVADTSGNDNHATQSTSSQQPEAALTALFGRPAMVFKESETEEDNSFLEVGVLSELASGYTIVQVVSVASKVNDLANSFARFWITTDDAQVLFFRQQNGAIELKCVNDTSAAGTPRPTFDWDLYHGAERPAVVAARVGLTSREIRLNGRAMSAVSDEVGSYVADATFGIGWTGEMTPGAVPGHFGDCMIFEGALSDEDIARVERYLCNKYGIAYLPSALANMRNVAHRGESDAAPENTIPAYSTADITDPAKFNRWVECDIRKTSDGVWVLMHDATVDRTTDGTGNVADLTLAEIKQLDAGSWFDESFVGTQVPTFEEFLEHCAANNLRCYVEPKVAVSNTDVDDILAMVDATIGRANFVWQSFTSADLDKMRAATDEVEVGLLAGTYNSAHLTAVQNYGNAFYFLDINEYAAYDKRKAILDAGVTVDLYTASAPSHKVWCANWGARGVTSNSFIEV